MNTQEMEAARDKACEILLKPDTTVTINGNPAGVSGFSKPFAHVTDRTTRLSCEFSWHAVLHVLTTKNGAFES
jgi:hypothetical protein